MTSKYLMFQFLEELIGTVSYAKSCGKMTVIIMFWMCFRKIFSFSWKFMKVSWGFSWKFSWDFVMEVRTGKQNFNVLVEKLRNSLEYEERSMWKPGFPTEKQLLIFIWYLSNMNSTREISRMFGVSKSTTHKCVRRVSRAICNMKMCFITFPNKTEKEEIS